MLKRFCPFRLLSLPLYTHNTKCSVVSAAHSPRTTSHDYVVTMEATCLVNYHRQKTQQQTLLNLRNTFDKLSSGI